jgi:hypothetical protein
MKASIIHFEVLGKAEFIYCYKHEYEEIHSPHIEEDGSTLLIERK